MESVALGVAVTPTAFVVVATTSFGGVAHAPLAMMVCVVAMMCRYGVLAPATIPISVARVVVGVRPIFASQPAAQVRIIVHTGPGWACSRPRVRSWRRRSGQGRTCRITRAPAASPPWT